VVWIKKVTILAAALMMAAAIVYVPGLLAPLGEDHYGSPAPRGYDRSYMDGRMIEVCDWTPDLRNAYVQAGSARLYDQSGSRLPRCEEKRLDFKPAWHYTGAGGSHGPTSFHRGGRSGIEVHDHIGNEHNDPRPEGE
jgi:hypothetical protein